MSRMNEIMTREKYDEKTFWHGFFGESVHELWSRYKATWESGRLEDISRQMIREPSPPGSEGEMVDLDEAQKQDAMAEGTKPVEFAA